MYQLQDLTLAEATELVNQQTVSQITYALMCRLWITHASTIVGLLGVGLPRSNFYEFIAMFEMLSQWLRVLTFR